MSTFLTIVVVLVILLGLWLIIRSMLAKDFEGDTKTLAYKDGLPILPRDERGQSALSVGTQSQNETVSAKPVKSGRELADEAKADALSSLAMVASQDPNAHNAPQDDGADILADEPIKKSGLPSRQVTLSKTRLCLTVISKNSKPLTKTTTPCSTPKRRLRSSSPPKTNTMDSQAGRCLISLEPMG